MGRYLLALVCFLAVGLSSVQAAVTPYCCPHYWTLRGNRCYRFIGKAMDWHSAQGHCKGLDHKANLVSLNTAGEEDFILHMWAEKGSRYDRLWVGFNDLDWEGHYKWVGINKPLDYTNWLREQPNNYGHSQDCGAIHTISGYWNDETCTRKYAFICERPRPGA
ncbi:echinoidin-like [Patiria miniata]|uniref:C-type lectin domain-containing protein n=1 Tax=Patiria miniata TaxID=46514 RepID=A0A914BA16_PATMI|nr:echinoidin-like [Patiria miniata]